MGRLNEQGILFIEGRKKDLIIVSGFKVYPQEAEEVLLEMDGIARVTVVGEKRALRGEMVKAYIVPQEGVTIEPKEVVGFCKKKLPPYKVPRLVEIVSDLPQTVTGKVMKYLITSGGKRWKWRHEDPFLGSFSMLFPEFLGRSSGKTHYPSYRST
ncbi:MAG: AMP-binding enzyme [Candidatus Caldatribacteriaceae bacterium]